MKTKEELNEIKKEIEAINEKCRELTPEELKEVTGGAWTRGDLTGTFFVTKQGTSKY